MPEKELSVSELAATFASNVFVMMRYRDDAKYGTLESTIRQALARYGLHARLAKDRAIRDDVWANIVHYMTNCQFGLAAFEEIDEREYNPNISMELGFMYALERRCLLLKDRRMPQLPTDICGKIYKNFDTYDIETTVNERIAEWCENDLRLRLPESVDSGPVVSERLLFDSNSMDPGSRAVSIYGSPADIARRVLRSEAQSPLFELRSFAGLPVGVNISVRTLFGRAEFEYQVPLSSSQTSAYFCMIPMQDTGVGRSGLIEVGADVEDHPSNATSHHRVRFPIPGAHLGDGQWHSGTIPFDFRDTPTAFYSIFAPRLNEGCVETGAGHLLIANVRIYSNEHT
ncbi:MAG: hypothetical protein HW416_2883 [Chloroflexi bacterium]|nr:hypothetical protein [Chloroflexota bacterium]